MKRKLTPALEQYFRIKEKFQNTILLFRMGDFYEMFYDDAKIASRELEIALTSRAFGKSGEKAPMCGFPHHAADSYIGKLVKKGYSVAICEQLEEPKPGKKVVDRDVVRVITPGTFFEDETEDRFLLSAIRFKDRVSLSWVELSTGDLYFTTANEEGLKSILSKFKPKEVIIPERDVDLELVIKEQVPESFIQVKDDFYFKPDDEKSPDIENEAELKALSALRKFIRETQIGFTPKLKLPKRYSDGIFMFIDPYTQKNLELVEPIVGKNKDFTLFGVLDRTKTGMGKRLLRFSVLHPFINREKIEERLDAVEEIKNSYLLKEEIASILNSIYDLERILSKITSGIASPKDIASLRRSIENLPKLKKLIGSFSSRLLSKTASNFDDLYDIYCEIERVLVENPPFTSREGGLIKDGVIEELDNLRKLKKDAETIIREIERRERERTGIGSLKVGFNNVFGYYIEVSKPNLHLVPDDYIRKQTLVNAERFITPELKSFEERVLSAQERIEKIEYEAFVKLRNFITENAERIQKTAEDIALIDLLLSFAEISNLRDYKKPKIEDDFSLEIERGKHPVLEKFLEEDFIPNNVRFNRESFIYIVTGPNMGGKSVFLRQTALITIMAQMGCFVPAERANIGIVDRVFSRVGASDSLGKGLSTFMMEMVETANIIRSATERSLIILDEVGRGTSTNDGMSIAMAVIEYIAKEIGAKTLFATHYHELTELEGRTKGIKNLHVGVKEINGQIIFTHKVLPGASEKSYGIHVAEIAGLPEPIIKRASEILGNFENSNFSYEIERERETSPSIAEREEILFNNRFEEILKEIENIEISTTTPLNALIILSRLKELVKVIKKEK